MRNKKGIVSRVLVLSILLISIFFATSCMTARPVMNNASFPADGSKYVILGRVSVTLDLKKSGGGYTKLLEEAKKQYPKADDVVNIVMDAKGKRALFSKVYEARYVIISGVVIDYIETK